MGEVFLTDEERLKEERETRLKNKIINGLTAKLQEYRNKPLSEFKELTIFIKYS